MKQVHKKGAVHALPVHVETLHGFRLPKKTCNAEWQWHRLSRTFTAYSLPVPSRLNGRRRNCQQFHPCWQVASHGLSNETSKWFSLIILKCKRFSGLWIIVPRRLQAKTRPARVTKQEKTGRRKLAFAERKLHRCHVRRCPWDPPPSSCPNSKLSSFRPNLALDFEGGHVFFEMPSLLTQKRALQVSTWSLLCLGLVPSGGKALLGGTIAQLQVAHNPKRAVLQSIHLLSDPCCWEVEKADCRLQCHSFITISYMILILSSLL